MSDMDKDISEQELEQEAMAAAQAPVEEKSKKPKADKSDKKPAAKKDKKKGNRVSRWLKELRAELKKVTWPTRKQTLNNTAVVIAVCLIVGVFIWVLDAVAVAAISGLMTLFGKA